MSKDKVSKESKMHSFRSSLSVGEAGERQFMITFECVHTGRGEYDFCLNGESVELKTSSYDDSALFVEILGDVEQGWIGGPFRAVKDKVEVYAYYYPKNEKFYFYPAAELTERIGDIAHKYKLRTHRNKHHDGNYTTMGLLIPRDEVIDLAWIYDIKGNCVKQPETCESL